MDARALWTINWEDMEQEPSESGSTIADEKPWIPLRMPIYGEPNYNRRLILPAEWIAQAKGEIPSGTIDSRCQICFSDRHDTFHCANKAKRTQLYGKKLGTILAKKGEMCQQCETEGHVYKGCPHIKYGGIKFGNDRCSR